MEAAVVDGMVGVNEAARVIGVNASTVSRQLAKLVSLGAVTVEERGRLKLFSLEDFRRGYEQHCNPLKARRGGAAIALGIAPAAEGEAAAAQIAAEPAAAPANAAPSAYADASANEKRVRALREQLRLDREMGKLVDRAAVEADLATAARNLRDGLLALPGRLKGELASMTNPAEIGALLDTNIRELLDAMVRDFAQAARTAETPEEGNA